MIANNRDHGKDSSDEAVIVKDRTTSESERRGKIGKVARHKDIVQRECGETKDEDTSI